MSETKMSVKLLAHTQLSEEFYDSLDKPVGPSGYNGNHLVDFGTSDGQAIALTAIRTCYSPLKPSDIVAKEGEKYFGYKATDGEGGTEADRLFRHITRSGHLSTLEHLSYTFAIEGVSRSLLAQLTRHRVGFSYSVQSQRYCKFGSGDKSGGFEYVVPEGVEASSKKLGVGDYMLTASDILEDIMHDIQDAYDNLRELGVTAEDARAVLPQAAACNLTMTANLRSLLDFCGKRQKGRGAQGEIAELAERLKGEVVKVEPWTVSYFKEA